MSVPAFNTHGVIPPFVGIDPGGPSAQMSPYLVTPVDVVNALGSTLDRLDILGKWLKHRDQLRGKGIEAGFQWLDGSFVEKKDPQDLDVTTFFRRPRKTSAVEMSALMAQNLPIFGRTLAKSTYRLDVFWVDMDGRTETVIDLTRYYCGLFSHSRGNFLWKGMLRVDLASKAVDDIAAAAIQQSVTLLSTTPSTATP